MLILGPISNILPITNFVRFIDPQNLYLACWAISYNSSLPTWIHCRKRDVLKQKILLCYCVNAWPLDRRVTINVSLQRCYALSCRLLSAEFATRLKPKHPLYVNTQLFCNLFVWWFSSFYQVFVEFYFTAVFKTHPH